MKTTLRQVLRSPKFMIGFCTFTLLLVMIFAYPLFNPGDPLEMIGLGTFFKPGTYVSLYDSVDAPRIYTLKLSDSAANRIAAKLLPQDRIDMKEWLLLYGMDEDEIDIEDTRALLQLCWKHYDPDKRIEA